MDKSLASFSPVFKNDEEVQESLERKDTKHRCDNDYTAISKRVQHLRAKRGSSLSLSLSVGLSQLLFLLFSPPLDLSESVRAS